MRRLKSFLLILIALWLPLQSAMAWTMPLCRHDAGQATARATVEAESAVAAPHCHEMSAEMSMASATSAADAHAVKSDDDSDCDNCGVCHLASAGYLMTAQSASPRIPVADTLATRQPLAPPSHIGEPPLQPPRRLS
jgi:hypothetical protein